METLVNIIPSNIIGDVATTLILAKLSGLIDMKQYNSAVKAKKAKP